MNATEIWAGVGIMAIALALFALVANAEYRSEVLQLIIMAVLVGFVGFGFALLVQGMW